MIAPETYALALVLARRDGLSAPEDDHFEAATDIVNQMGLAGYAIIEKASA